MKVLLSESKFSPIFTSTCNGKGRCEKYRCGAEREWNRVSQLESEKCDTLQLVRESELVQNTTPGR